MYPKGFCEMLERREEQFVAALQELFRREHAGKRCFSEGLPIVIQGAPLTHYMLADLNVLGTKPGTDEMEIFEEDAEKIRCDLIANGATMERRRSSFGSDSDHSGHHDFVQTPSDNMGTPFDTKPNPDGCNYSAPSSRPASESPMANQAPVFANSHPLMNGNDPQSWRQHWVGPDHSNVLRSNSFVAAESPLQGNTVYGNMGGMGSYDWHDINPGIDYNQVHVHQEHAQPPSAHFNAPVLYHNPNFGDTNFDFSQFVEST